MMKQDIPQRKKLESFVSKLVLFKPFCDSGMWEETVADLLS